MALDAAYRAFVAGQAGASVWHDADLLLALVSPARREQMDYAAVFERDGLGRERMVAILPFCRKTRLDGWVVTLPPLMRYCGPLFDADWLEGQGLHRALGEVWAVLPEGYRSFDQSWPIAPELLPPPGDWPLHVCPRTTHIADLTGGPEQLAAAPTKQMRYDLRRAARTLRAGVTHALAPTAAELLGAPYRRQNIARPFANETLEVLFDVLGPREQIACVEVLDEAGQLQACAVIVADATTAYALLTAVSESARALSGGSFAMYEGMRWAMGRGCARFDFLGSETAGIADNFRRLGGAAGAYSHAYGDTVWWTHTLRRPREKNG